MKTKKIYVIGHKNPDTDSICSAIAYAYLKNALEPGKYAPKRAGQLNAETTYVLDRFKVKPPEYIPNVATQISDLAIRDVPGVEGDMSLKKAWELMKQINETTIPILKSDNKIEGLITTEDIARSYMDVYDSKVLATAGTKYKNIVDTLDGEMVVGDGEASVCTGKVVIAAATPDVMEEFIEPNDLVILGNRYESQLCAIEIGVGCLIVGDGAKITKTIRQLAESHGCTLISSPHDTYTLARLINQSIPISYFMRSENLVVFQRDEFIDNVRDIMTKKRYHNFPVVDRYGKYRGIVSRRNMLNASKKQLILVDHNEKSQAVDGIDQAEILEIIDHHRIAAVQTMAPVYFRNEPLGCTATIVFEMYREKNVEIPPTIAGLLLAAILSDTLLFRSPTCTSLDKYVAGELAKISGIVPEELAQEMFKAGSNLKDKSPEEIFYQDFKKFNIDGVSFGIGQINSMDGGELENIREKLATYLEKAQKEHRVDAIFFMLTNIMTESTDLIYCGQKAEGLVADGFGIKSENGVFHLEGVVSRKKQLLPTLMKAIQQ
ncbi:MAG: putative manganese-dependent inorganic diphosphatase [Lachnospiraceae bacterium]|nr:putative manganese-dependent inorganic diphosphatase [Lachnospiraceae bacterium]